MSNIDRRPVIAHVSYIPNPLFRLVISTSVFGSCTCCLARFGEGSGADTQAMSEQGFLLVQKAHHSSYILAPDHDPRH